jgi:hypothetical protein
MISKGCSRVQNCSEFFKKSRYRKSHGFEKVKEQRRKKAKKQKKKEERRKSCLHSGQQKMT